MQSRSNISIDYEFTWPRFHFPYILLKFNPECNAHISDSIKSKRPHLVKTPLKCGKKKHIENMWAKLHPHFFYYDLFAEHIWSANIRFSP